MRRFFEIVLVMVLVTISTIFLVIAVIFPAPGVRRVFRRLAETFSELAKRV